LHVTFVYDYISSNKCGCHVLHLPLFSVNGSIWDQSETVSFDSCLFAMNSSVNLLWMMFISSGFRCINRIPLSTLSICWNKGFLPPSRFTFSFPSSINCIAVIYSRILIWIFLKMYYVSSALGGLHSNLLSNHNHVSNVAHIISLISFRFVMVFEFLSLNKYFAHRRYFCLIWNLLITY